MVNSSGQAIVAGAGRWRALLVLIAGVAAASALAEDARLTGAVRLVDHDRELDLVEDVAVYFRHEEPTPVVPPAEPLLMKTYRKAFDPRVLPLVVGSTVRFPNRDPILHNVFSLSRGNSFDLGLYGPGDGASHTFETTGLVRIYCNVHQSMVAHVLVLDTPHFTMAEQDGTFTLAGLPPGPGVLYAWHERAERVASRALTVPMASPVALELTLTGRRVPDHRNKFGQRYGGRRGRDRY